MLLHKIKISRTTCDWGDTENDLNHIINSHLQYSYGLLLYMCSSWRMPESVAGWIVVVGPLVGWLCAQALQQIPAAICWSGPGQTQVNSRPSGCLTAGAQHVPCELSGIRVSLPPLWCDLLLSLWNSSETMTKITFVLHSKRNMMCLYWNWITRYNPLYSLERRIPKHSLPYWRGKKENKNTPTDRKPNLPLGNCFSGLARFATTCTLKLHKPNIRQSEKMWPSANMKLAGLATLSWDLAASHAGASSRPSLSLQIPACTCRVRESAQFCSGTSR